MKRTKHFGRVKATLAGAVLIVSAATPTLAMVSSSSTAKVAGDMVFTKPVDKPSNKLF